VVARTFDDSIHEHVSIDGVLGTYRCVDNCWELRMSSASARIDNESIHSPELVVFACQRNPETSGRSNKKKR
jgi:hypothetical protein